MIKEYIFKTIISFISLNAIMHITKDNWYKLNPKRNGVIKRMFNRLLFCLIPVVRWIFIIIILVIGIALGSDNFVNELKSKIGDDK